MQARLRELDDLLKRLVGQGSLPQQRTMILEWTLSSLALDGIALLQAGRDPAGGVETRASLGSLPAIAPLLAAELSWTGIPTKQGILPLPPGSDRHDAQRTQDALQRTQGAAIRSLARLAEYRDPETGYHLQRICEYTRLIAMQVHLRAPYSFRITAEYANDISLSVMLHDIGKVSIPDHILLKPGKLDPEEWEMMKKHTVFGWDVLHKADRELGEQSFLTLAASIARSHHERFDGKGYPEGTAGEQIHLSARIAAIADVYDALTTARPYKEAWSHERAVAEILGQAGTQFDPVLVAIFRDLNDQFADVRRRFPG